MKKTGWALLALAGMLGAAVAQDALASAVKGRKAQGPTRITSDRLEFDYKDYVALFDGNVKVADPQFVLTANKMLVFFENTNDVRRVDAVGNVKVVSLDRTVTCGKATYLRANGSIEMFDQPVVSKGENTIRGRKITIWIDDNRVEVDGAVQLEGTTGSR